MWPSDVESLSAVTVFASVVAASFVSEDATLLSSCALAAQGKVSLAVVFWANWVGIVGGDLVLYLAARGIFGHGRMRRWLEGRSPRRLEQGQALFRRYGWVSLLIARFLPGTRLAIYTGAGALRFPSFPFTAIIAITGTIWVAAWVYWIRPGERFPWGWALAALVVIVLFVRSVFASGGFRAWWFGWQRWQYFEFWSPYVFYIPVVFHYFRLAFRYRNLTLPSAVNPKILHGGWVGESKSAILDPLRMFPDVFLPFQVFDPGTRLDTVESYLAEAGLELPVILKPDVGQRGSGVVLVRGWRQLAEVAATYKTRFLIQCYSARPNEVGVFYVRFPGQAKGRITSITEKRFPVVLGDGKSTLRELILNDSRAKWMATTFLRRHAERLRDVPAKGIAIRLVEAGNHCQGAVFLDGKHLVSQSLLDTLDRISHALELYAGRLDLRYESDAELQAGRFHVVEINGAGAEATHIYAPGTSLREAYRVLFEQWDMLFAIGDANRRLGTPTISVVEFFKTLYLYRQDQRSHPATT